MTAAQLFAPRPEVVALVTDCMRNLDNNLIFAEIPDWKHEDGSPVTEQEIEVIRSATLGELDIALGLVVRPMRGRLFKPGPDGACAPDGMCHDAEHCDRDPRKVHFDH